MAGQERGLFLQDLGEDFKVRLTVLVGKLSCRQLHLGRDGGLDWPRTGSYPPCYPPVPQEWASPVLTRSNPNSPGRCPGSTRQPGCHSLAWWGPGGQCAQAIGKRRGRVEKGEGAPGAGGRCTTQAPRLPARQAPTYCHVGSTASAPRFGFGVNKAATDAKVAEFDLAPLVQQDVGGLDVPVDHPVLLFQVIQRLHNL